MNRFGKVIAISVASALPMGCSVLESGNSHEAQAPVVSYPPQPGQIDQIAVGDSIGPDMSVDISNIPELDPRFALKAAAALVTIVVDEKDKAWQGTGFVSLPAVIGSNQDFIYTAGHVVSTVIGASPVMPVCDEMTATFFDGETKAIDGRSAVYNDDGSRDKYHEGKITDIKQVNPPTVDEGEVLTQAPEQPITGLQLDLSGAETQPGDFLYIVAPQDGHDYRHPVVFPVLVTDQTNHRINLLTGIGASANDDLKPGMSGSPILTKEGNVVGIAVESSPYRESAPTTYINGQGNVGNLDITGVSADGEELTPATETVVGADGTTKTIDLGKGFTVATGQLFTSNLFEFDTNKAVDCNHSVPADLSGTPTK